MQHLFKSRRKSIFKLRKSRGPAGARRPVRRPVFEPLEDRRLLANDVGAVQSALPQFQIKHEPRLQLGDAPLAEYTGITTDQVQILWQTIPAGAGTTDTFLVDYRAVASSDWTNAGAIETIDTGVAGRINHYVDITGLLYDSDYEYRVQQLRDGVVVASYQDTFHTRLPSGDSSEFSFAAYGDSADIDTIGNFQLVQDRINQIDPAFAIALGDNAYRSGSHADFDARFDPDVNPEAALWTASHIDYLSVGNHDIVTASGQPLEENIAVPIPVAGVTAPATLDPGERAEHNYSFDYGMVHFATFDSNSVSDAARLDAQLDWLEADLAASTARWKIVAAHHPVAGTPDKPESPADNYYKQVVPRLRTAGVDLLLTGHSHAYSWTYPLLGNNGDDATFVLDADNDYAKGAGLVQVVSGVGGRASLRSGDYSDFPFIASGYTLDTATRVEFGVTQIDVTADQLTVSYVAADDGAIIDQFSITDTNLPLVNVAVTDADASETGADPGEFSVFRTGDLVGALVVSYTVAGSASDGVDYTPLSGTVTIPDGKASAVIAVTPVDDIASEGPETVTVSLSSDAAYVFGGGEASATLSLQDDEHPTPFLATVRVRLSDRDYLNLNEVEVLELGTGTNLAIAGTATQSSTFDANTGAEKANDGDTTSGYPVSLAHTEKDTGAWWKVDLGGGFDVGTITVYNRSSSGTRLEGAVVEALDSLGSVFWSDTVTGASDGSIHTFVVSSSPETATVSWANPADISFGTELSAEQLNATADQAGTFVYTPPLGTVLDAGPSQSLTVTFTPDDLAAFDPVSAEVLVNVLAIQDFGDAPSVYPVRLTDDGARHTTTTLRLGSAADLDADGQPTDAADGDGDDDDGVLEIASLVAVAGQDTVSSFHVDASEAGKLDAWIDFNQDGDWDDSGEQVFSGVNVNTGVNALGYTIPSGAMAGDTAARFRISSTGGLAPTGSASDGEVEDYLLRILDGLNSPDAQVDAMGSTTNVSVAAGEMVVQSELVELFRASVANLGSLAVLGSDNDETYMIDVGRDFQYPSSGLQLSGGVGANTLVVVGDGGLIDFTDALLSVTEFPTLDLSSGDANVVTVDVSAVAGLSPASKELTIITDANDQIVVADADTWRMAESRISGDIFMVTANNVAGDEVIAAELSHPWRNFLRAGDVNNDGSTTAADALRIINELGRRKYSNPDTQALMNPLDVADWPDVYFDHSGDDRATALDALRVINDIARQLAGGGSSEGEAIAAVLTELGEENNESPLLADFDVITTRRLRVDASVTDAAGMHFGVSVWQEMEAADDQIQSRAVDQLLASEDLLEGLWV